MVFPSFIFHSFNYKKEDQNWLRYLGLLFIASEGSSINSSLFMALCQTLHTVKTTDLNKITNCFSL